MTAPKTTADGETNPDFESTYLTGFSAYLTQDTHTITIRLHYDDALGGVHVRNIYFKKVA